MNQPSFIASLDVQRISQLLANTEVGNIVTYRQMSEEIGRDIQTEARGVLISARRITQRELGYIFGTIHGKGLQRLSDIEIVQTGAQTVVKIRHASRRGTERIANVAMPENLPIESRIRMNCYLSMLAMVNSISQEKRLKKLEERVALAEARLPLEKTLDAFKD